MNYVLLCLPVCTAGWLRSNQKEQRAKKRKASEENERGKSKGKEKQWPEKKGGKKEERKCQKEKMISQDSQEAKKKEESKEVMLGRTFEAKPGPWDTAATGQLALVALRVQARSKKRKDRSLE